MLGIRDERDSSPIIEYVQYHEPSAGDLRTVNRVVGKPDFLLLLVLYCCWDMMELKRHSAKPPELKLAVVP